MAEEIATITTEKPEAEVFKQIEDSLSSMGQTSITKKGAISINPKGAYNNFAAHTKIEGTVRQKPKGGQYDVTIEYSVSPTGACWVIGILGGVTILLPAAIFVIPYYTMRTKVRTTIARALQQAQEELE